MTEELAALLDRLTCRRCLGNGHVGGRQDTGASTESYTRRDVGHGCPDCQTTGLRLAADGSPSVLVIGSDNGWREVLAQLA